MSSLFLIFTSLHAQDWKDTQDWKDNWRKSPLTSKNSNEWRNKPYVSKTTDNWRNSPLSAKQSQSKLRWNTNEWKKNPTNWRNKPYIKKPVSSEGWQNRWDKRKWRDSPLNWRNSELRYKNTVKKFEGGTVIQEVRELGSPDIEADKEPISQERKEYKKAKVETITEEVEIISEKTPDNLGHTKNYFIVTSGEKSFRIEKNVHKSIHMAPGGLMEIYSSKAENH
jgi:hypothetical protein